MNQIYSSRKKLIIKITVLCFFLSLTGCDQKEDTKPSSPPLVSVAEVTTQTIPVYLEFPGSIEAVKSVELLARVEGFLLSRNFQEGSTVNEGDLLYVIDPKPFEAALKKTEGQLAESKAALIDAQLKLERQSKLAKKDFVSQQVLDNIRAQVEENKGKVKADQAAVDEANLDLSYTSVYAPFTGRIGYTEVNIGNLVTPDKNPKLARLVQMDPIYVVFSPSDTLLTRLSELQNKAPIQVSLFLNDNSEYVHEGKVDAIDNRIDPATNTIKIRAVIPNPDSLLIPGEFIKVRTFLGNQENAILVPQAALDEQQGGYQVFIVDSDNKVTAQAVKLGSTYQEMRVVVEGLKSGDQVIVSGLQKLKSGTKIKRETTTSQDRAAQPKQEPDQSIQNQSGTANKNS